MSTDSPASPVASRLDTSGEMDREGLGSPCFDLDGLSSSDGDIGTLGGLSDVSATQLRDDDERSSPLLIQIRSSQTWIFPRSLGRTISDRLPRVNICRGRFP